MKAVILQKYKYVGTRPTKVKLTPQTKPVAIKTGDEVVSQIVLPSHLFKKIELSNDEALQMIGEVTSPNTKTEEQKTTLTGWDLAFIKHIVKLLQKAEIEIPSGTKTKEQFVAFAKEKGIPEPTQEVIDALDKEEEEKNQN